MKKQNLSCHSSFSSIGSKHNHLLIEFNLCKSSLTGNPIKERSFVISFYLTNVPRFMISTSFSSTRSLNYQSIESCFVVGNIFVKYQNNVSTKYENIHFVGSEGEYDVLQVLFPNFTYILKFILMSEILSHNKMLHLFIV